MRRGLLAWDRAEVPEAVLDARLARLQAAMAEAGLDALLLYTNFPRPAAVSYLTHFVPYWSQGLLVVRPEGPTTLVISLSKRVGGWIEETSHIGEIVCTPRIGVETAKLLSGTKRIGVLELSKLPGGIARPLVDGLEGAGLQDATAAFRAARAPADDAEIALASRAAEIAEKALAKAAGSHETTAPLAEAIESSARLAGAEEVQTFVAPDLDADARLRRLDGVFPLGARYAVQASVAYKGHWVRLGRTFDGGGALDPPTLSDVAALGGFSDWTIEGCVGSPPLSVLARKGGATPALPAGSIVTVSATAEVDGKPCFASGPVLLAAEPGGAATQLPAR